MSAHTDPVFLHALRLLPPDEAAAFEAHLQECAECRQELETLAPIIGSFDEWPTDVLRPAVSLWTRVAQRITADAGDEAATPPSSRWVEPEWSDVGQGISCKMLAADSEQDRVSMLVRLAPGAEYPPHRHSGVEELHLLDGELVVDEKTLGPGDYLRAEAGTVDRRVWSRTGCTCVLVTSSRDILL